MYQTSINRSVWYILFLWLLSSITHYPKVYLNSKKFLCHLTRVFPWFEEGVSSYRREHFLASKKRLLRLQTILSTPLSNRRGGGGEAFLLQLQSCSDTRLNVLHIRSRLKPINDVTVSINEELREVPLDTRVFCIVRIVCFKLFI